MQLTRLGRLQSRAEKGGWGQISRRDSLHVLDCGVLGPDMQARNGSSTWQMASEQLVLCSGCRNVFCASCS